ncbi:MAG TPA: hypothetical protein EYM48_05555 [Campylobacterales bacterium]|nr:hypothetical protein [Campylobacterales bacterium]
MYLTKKNTTYYYRRKTPQILIPILNTAIIKRSLCTSNKIAAIQQASYYTSILHKAMLACSIDIPIENIISILKPLLSDSANTTIVIKVERLKFTTDIIEKYLTNLVISQDKIKAYRARLHIIYSIIDAREMTPAIIDEIILTLQTKIPKRYKILKKSKFFKEIINMEYRQSELLSIGTVNVYLVLFRSILKWVYAREYLTKDYSDLVIKLKDKGAASLKTDALTDEIIEKILTKINPRERLFLLGMRFSGLRPTELLQSEVTEIDNILCFDLRNPNIQVKNLNSRRLVPIHSKLIPKLEELTSVLAKYKTVKVISRNTTTALRELGLPSTATLYSLRHTFITKLINLGADNNIVSALVGHSLQGNQMTMDRYFKGYDVKKLKETIELL